MKMLFRAFGAVHAVAALFFAAVALLLMAIGVRAVYEAIGDSGLDENAALGLIEALGIAAIAVVSLQISQTIAEEEVIREVHVSSPTRVRRFLSRFLVVVLVALAIESLIATFKALHEHMADLVYASVLVCSVGALLLGWGAFIWLNRAAEELEPEAMDEAKDEDEKLKQ